MDNTVKRIIQKAMAMLIVFVMMMAEFSLVASYAIDAIITNNENVAFVAYFENADGEKVSEANCEIGETLKLKVDVTVGNKGGLGGQFEGNFALSNSNFKFKKTPEKVYVEAGKTETYEQEVVFVESEKISKDYLNQMSKVTLTGKYKNSKNVEVGYDITGESSVKVNWLVSEDLVADLSAELMTNSIYKVETENKRIVQVLVKSNVKDNAYPVKENVLELNVPENVESVKVHKRNTLATNGDKEFSENNYNYNSENHTLTINVKNEEENGKIAWYKNVKDIYVVTYIFSEEANVDANIKVNNTITTYDNKTLNSEKTVAIDGEIDGIVTSSISEHEKEIYKGKIYVGDKREYNSDTILNIDYAEAITTININEKASMFVENDTDKNANVNFLKTKISKNDVMKILGQEANIIIRDQNNNEIGKITKDSETDNDGNVVIDYPQGVKELNIKTSKPVNEGILKFYHTKNILNNNYSRDEVGNFTKLKDICEVEYFKENDESKAETVTGIVTLKEPQTKIDVNLNKDTLLAVGENTNIDLLVKLDTADESKSLYKNPTLDIVLPKTVKDVEVITAQALYRNGLEVSSSRTVTMPDGSKVLKVAFSGEQTSYDTNGGMEVHLFISLDIDDLATNNEDSINVTCANELNNSNAQVVKKFNIQIQNGFVIYNNVNNVSNFERSDEYYVMQLAMNEAKKNITSETYLLNNYNSALNNVSLIGKIPQKGENGTFSAVLKGLSTNKNGAQIYYSTDNSNWTKNIENAKFYKIEINSLSAKEMVKVTTELEIPANLKYNESASLELDAKYNYNDKEQEKNYDVIFSTKTSVMTLSANNSVDTELESGVKVSVISRKGNLELSNNDNVYEGETINYEITITNNSQKDYNDLNVKAKQINGKMWGLIEVETTNPFTKEKTKEHEWNVTNSNEISFDKISKLEKNQSVTLKYSVKINNLQEDKDNLTFGEITLSNADNSINEKVTTIKNKIQEAKLALEFLELETREVEWFTGGFTHNLLNVSNKSNDVLENVYVTAIISSNLSCDNDDYVDLRDFNGKVSVQSKTENENGETIVVLKIQSIAKNETIEIPFNTEIENYNDNEQNMKILAKADVGTETFYSNVFERTTYNDWKKIDFNCFAYVNNKLADENVILKDNDVVEFKGTIKNNVNKTINFCLEDELPNGFELSEVKIIKDGNVVNDASNISKENLYEVVELDANKEVEFNIKAMVDIENIGEDVSNTVLVSSPDFYNAKSAQYNFKTNYVNDNDDDGELNFEIVQTANKKDLSEVKAGDKLEYVLTIKNLSDFERNISINNKFNAQLKNIKIILNDKDISDKGLSTFYDCSIAGKSQAVLRFSGEFVDSGNESVISEFEIINNSNSRGASLKSNTITYKYAKLGDVEDLEGTDGTGNSKDPADSGNSGNSGSEKYTIKGVAWLDENKNSKRDSDEKLLKNIPVVAIDSKTGEIKGDEVLTSSNGEYSFTLEKGTYIIAFLYNSDDYYVTTYQLDGVDEKLNSDFVQRTMKIKNENKIVAASNTIDLKANIENIDMGLLYKEKFDLKIEKYVSKMVVTNAEGTKTYNFNKDDLAKVEIAAKHLNNSTVLIEYKMRVTNVGELDGYADVILDKLPTGLDFQSNLNSDWYKKETKLYNDSLEKTKIKAGESKEVTLVLTKKMTESNTGLINNVASIESSHNNKGIKDINLENDSDSVDTIVMVKTGEAILFASVTFIVIGLIGLAAYIIVKKFLIRNI